MRENKAREIKLKGKTERQKEIETHRQEGKKINVYKKKESRVAVKLEKFINLPDSIMYYIATFKINFSHSEFPETYGTALSFVKHFHALKILF